jgi:hypothetical protein
MRILTLPSPSTTFSSSGLIEDIKGTFTNAHPLRGKISRTGTRNESHRLRNVFMDIFFDLLRGIAACLPGDWKQALSASFR